MAFNNGHWKDGSAGSDIFDMGQQDFWDVADNYRAGAGNDTVKGNIADNVIEGGSGRDTIDGWWGNDTIYGGNDADTLKGDLGQDWLYGESGNDTLDGGNDSDHLYGGDGTDVIYGGDGTDFLYGEAGTDTLYGGAGNDTLDGGRGADTLSGGDGIDKLYDGSTENVVDVMSGGDGNDYLESRGGGDIMSGGADSDTFSIGNATTFRALGGNIAGGSGIDTVVLRDAADIDNFSFMSSIEKFDLEASSNQTLRLDFNEVSTLSGTNQIAVYGEAGDRLFLQDDVPGNSLDGGSWAAGSLSNPDSSGDRTQTYQYLDTAGDYTGISVTVDTAIAVFLV